MSVMGCCVCADDELLAEQYSMCVHYSHSLCHGDEDGRLSAVGGCSDHPVLVRV